MMVCDRYDISIEKRQCNGWQWRKRYNEPTTLRADNLPVRKHHCNLQWMKLSLRAISCSYHQYSEENQIIKPIYPINLGETGCLLNHMISSHKNLLFARHQKYCHSKLSFVIFHCFWTSKNLFHRSKMLKRRSNSA